MNRRFAHLFTAALAAALTLAPLAAVAPVRAQDSLEAAKKRELDDIRRQANEKRKAAAALKPRETRALGDLRRTEKQLTASRRRCRAGRPGRRAHRRSRPPPRPRPRLRTATSVRSPH